MNVHIHDFSSTPSADGIRVMSYNILTQTMINPVRYSTNGSVTDWNLRFSLLKSEIRNYDPDVLFLQEIDVKKTLWWGGFFNRQGMRMKWCFHPKKNHGVMVAWKSSLFELVDSSIVQFDKSNEPLLQDLKTTHSGVVVALRFVPTDNIFIVATTHLTWRPDFCYERLRQFVLLMKAVEKLKEFWQTSLVIIGGDFNATPNTPIHRVIADRNVLSKESLYLLRASAASPTSGINDRVDEALKGLADAVATLATELVSCYRHKWGREPEFTNWTDTFRATLDYIYVSSDFKVDAVLELPGAKDMGSEPSSIPRIIAGKAYPSDHLPIIAILTFDRKIGIEKADGLDIASSRVTPSALVDKLNIQ